MAKQTDPHRAVEQTDLQIVERAIADHEKFQANLFTLQRILKEIGVLDIAVVRRDYGAERGRRDAMREQAETAQQQLRALEKQIADKRRELVETEATIKDKIREAQLFDASCENLRNLLRAA